MALNYTTLDPSRINTFSIGFDRMFDSLTNSAGYSEQSNYPPYNIIKESDTEFLIQLAIAGFAKDDVEIRMVENKLSINSIDLSTSEIVLKQQFALIFAEKQNRNKYSLLSLDLHLF